MMNVSLCNEGPVTILLDSRSDSTASDGAGSASEEAKQRRTEQELAKQKRKEEVEARTKANQEAKERRLEAKRVAEAQSDAVDS